MRKPLNCIWLIDDNESDNFFHEMEVEEARAAREVYSFTDAESALNYLKDIEARKEVCDPDLIFLDLNMPGITGWEFLERYKKISSRLNAQIVILTTSLNPDDELRARQRKEIAGFKKKPLTANELQSVIEQFFPDMN